MPDFNFQAKSKDGQAQQGVLTANDRRAAVQTLQSRGLMPIKVEEANAAPTKKKAGTAVKQSSGPGGFKLPTRVILQFSIDLRDLLNAGLTLGSAIQKLANQSGNAVRSALLNEVHEDIVQGKSLSEALVKHPKCFSELYISLIRAGEASGQLQSALDHAVHHEERVAETREQVINALIYPIIVVSLGIAILVYMLVKVVPQFTQIFEDLDQALPMPTRVLIGMSNFLTLYGPILLIGLVVMGVVFSRWKQTEAGRLAWHGFLLRVPVFKNLIKSAAYANFARTLSNLLVNGVPVLTSLDITKNTANNAVLEREIAKLKIRVTDGSSLSRPLSESGVFPDLFIDMLSVGEEAGQVPRSLARIAERYDGELSRNVKRLTTLIEPFLMLNIAASIGFVAISLLLPVFTLSQGIR